MQKAWPPFALYSLAGIACLILSATSCNKKSASEIKKRAGLEDSLNIERAEGVEISYTDSGFLRARVFSPSMVRIHSNEPFTEMHKGLSAFFYSGGKLESSLRAGYGIQKEDAKTMEVRNNVVVRNDKGEELRTEKLVWDQRREMISTDQFVKIRRKDEILYGVGFESNETFTRYRILQLKGRISIKD